MKILLLTVYGLTMGFIFLFSLVQLHLVLVYLFRRNKYHQNLEDPNNTLPEQDYPHVTVQLPVFNEKYVVERLIDAVAAFDYPADKLEIQVLDDSTDETTGIIRNKISEHPGTDIQLIRRPDRKGFKAGALQYGLERAKGTFIAIFDADFLPQANFLHKTLPYFNNPDTGVVQTRWAHINKNYSLLTKLQAFGLDAHFTIEQVGRFTGGHFINFNGTAGIWRKTCIEDAGGWQPDTLTEDLDLSYRAQLKGWKFKYLEDIGSPAELPAAMNALKSQQYRWTKGAAESAKKNLPAVLKSRLPFASKVHSFFHLLNSSVFVCVFLSAVLSIPLLILKNTTPGYELVFKLAGVLIMSLIILSVYYWVSWQHIYSRQERSFKRFLFTFPTFLAMSMGMSLHNGIAVIEGYLGIKTPFIRTPKFNIKDMKDRWQGNKYHSRKVSPLTILEGLLAVYFLYGVYLAFLYADYGMLHFHVLLSIGFGAISYYSFKHAKFA